jgi:hypothetical protein
MLRMCALTVFTETDSSLAISGRDKFVGCLVQQQPDVRAGVCLQSQFGAPQPPLGLVELTQQHHGAGERHQRGRDHWFRAPAVPFGELYRLAAAPLGLGGRIDIRRGGIMEDIRAVNDARTLVLLHSASRTGSPTSTSCCPGSSSRYGNPGSLCCRPGKVWSDTRLAASLDQRSSADMPEHFCYES